MSYPAKIDAVVIGNYGVTDAALRSSGGATAAFELEMDGYPCDFEFLQEYFQCNRNVKETKRRMDAKPAVSRTRTYLSGVYLTDFLRRRAGINARTINNFSLEKDRLAGLLDQGPRFAVISTSLIIGLEHIREITEFIRARAPSTTIIVGGTKLYKSYKIKTLYDAGELPDIPMEFLGKSHYFFGPKRDEADYYIVNTRGETTLLKLISALSAGHDVHGLDNLAYYVDADVCQINPVTEEPYVLKDWSMDWSSVEEDAIGYEIPITVKQGCAFRCNFCDFTSLDRKPIARELDIVFAELRAIRKHFGEKNIGFVDDCLFLNKRHVVDFCTRLIKEKLDIRWRALCRAGQIDENNARLLKEAGCYNMSMGIESGDDRVLENMNKRVSAEQNLEAVCALNSAGIDTYCTFVVGFPGETSASVQNTIDLLNRFPSDRDALNFYHAFPFILPPLAPVSTREMRKRFKLIGLQSSWRHPTMNFKEATEQVIRIFREVKRTFCRYMDSPETTLFDNTVPQHRAILQTRQEIAQGRIQGMSEAEEAALWDRLEALFVGKP